MKESSKSTIPAKGEGRNLFLLTKETYEGEYDAFYFDTKEEAMEWYEKLKQMSGGEDLDDGFVTKDRFFHRVISLPEALSINGKGLWYVSHKCFLPGTYGKYDWLNFFATKNEAMELFKQRVEIYHDDIEKNPSLSFEENDRELIVLQNGIPVIYLQCLDSQIGLIEKIGTLRITE